MNTNLNMRVSVVYSIVVDRYNLLLGNALQRSRLIYVYTCMSLGCLVEPQCMVYLSQEDDHKLQVDLKKSIVVLL